MGSICSCFRGKEPGSPSPAPNVVKKPDLAPDAGSAGKKPGSTPNAVSPGKKPDSAADAGSAGKNPGSPPDAGSVGKKPSSSSPATNAGKMPGSPPDAGSVGEKPYFSPALKMPGSPPDAGSAGKKPSSSSPAPNAGNNPDTAVEGENVDVDLDDLIQYISELLGRIKGKSSRSKSAARQFWPSSSSGFLRLKEFLLEGIEGASALKDIVPGKTNIVRSLVNGIGQAHWTLAGLLVVANILERFETVSANRNECLSLLEEMNNLAQHVKKLKARPRLREEMKASIQNATELIVEGSIMCCTQIDSSKFSKFLLTDVNKDELLKFEQKLKRVSKRMENEMGICVYDAIECRMERPQKPRERTYPEDAVGIEEPLQQVIKLLDWESEENAQAVVLHGFGGIGKTLLADAVFARLYIEGCKYSMVRLFDDITSNPNIVELQKCILKDLTMKTHEVMTDFKTMKDKQQEIGHMLENIRTFEDGQREIGRVLEKEVAFIYIDNVLDGESLQQILPKDMKAAKKLRLLITARDINVCRMKKNVYAMKCLSNSEAMILLKKEMDCDQMDGKQMEQIVKTCGGVPKLLTLVAGFIRSVEDKQKACRIVLQDAEKLKGESFGNIERYVFAFDYLPEMCKDPFLDICNFFNGWDWDTVADIVGESELNMLENRALVTKDTNTSTARIHDVILKIGLNKAEGTRFKFTGASTNEIQEFLEIKDLQGIKGLWFSRTKDPLNISAKKLNLMYNSLRILALGNLIKVEETCNKTFEKMVFFQGEVPNLPFNVSWSKELRYLKWQPQDLHLLKEMPSNLKHMELDGKLHCQAFEIFSSDLRQLQNLRILRLIHFAGLKNLPRDLGDLIKGLQELTLSYSESIEELPSTISKLQSLRILRVNYCSSLKQLPEDFGSLNSLQELNLSDCKSIKELPRSMENLRSLRKLTLSNCTSIQELPRSISMLQSLRVLKMDNCSNLKRLPEDFGSLSSLQELNLSYCKSIKELPISILKLQSLRILRLNYCSSLEWLPDFGSLRSLQELELEGCERLELAERENNAPLFRSNIPMGKSPL